MNRNEIEEAAVYLCDWFVEQKIAGRSATREQLDKAFLKAYPHASLEDAEAVCQYLIRQANKHRQTASTIH